ncbi:MAG: AP2 domain-containing protein [Chloroflexota bacterium]|nr:AP2 domain-containing protein [Chloroflexota bacterium]
MVDYQKFNLGTYATAEEAAYVYDQAAVQLFGEFARPNLL